MRMTMVVTLVWCGMVAMMFVLALCAAAGRGERMMRPEPRRERRRGRWRPGAAGMVRFESKMLKG